uniref:Uncharacterized protein n=1 Tax=Arundo donax TaxID=35708 RepID=A0A0A9GMN6_ARUDO
MGATMAITGGG